MNEHLVVKDLALACRRIGNQGLVENLENVLAHLLKLGLDLAAVFANGAKVLVVALALLLLLDRGDDAPAGAAGTNDVLVRDAEKVALVDRELAAKHGHLLHEGDHLIVTLGLLAEAGEESLAVSRGRVVVSSLVSNIDLCFALLCLFPIVTGTRAAHNQGGEDQEGNVVGERTN